MCPCSPSVNILYTDWTVSNLQKSSMVRLARYKAKAFCWMVEIKMACNTSEKVCLRKKLNCLKMEKKIDIFKLVCLTNQKMKIAAFFYVVAVALSN